MKVTYAAPEPKRWSLMEWTDIPSKSDPELVYLRRLRILQTPWGAVYLHCRGCDLLGGVPPERPPLVAERMTQPYDTAIVYTNLAGCQH